MTFTTRPHLIALTVTSMTLAALTLTGCATQTPEPAFTNAVTIPNAPAIGSPEQTAGTTATPAPPTAGSTTATPTINLANGSTTVSIAENAIAFIATGPNDPATAWTATSVPAKQTNVMYVPATAGGQATLQAFTAGTATINLTNAASGARVTLIVTVTPTTLPAQTGTTSTVKTVDPHLDHATGDKLAKTVIGLTEDAATSKLAQSGYLARVTSRDGKDISVTLDYSTTRVNLTITAGKVTAATIG
jgi:hypothetical protein